jgi:hypothetical protein
VNYTNVKGPRALRFWQVTFDPANSNSELKKDDQLVFEGTAPSAITRYRGGLPFPWGDSCGDTTPKLGFQYAIKGIHLPSGRDFRIDFNEATDVRARHQGEIPELPDPDSANQILAGGTWMADEGP